MDTTQKYPVSIYFVHSFISVTMTGAFSVKESDSSSAADAFS